MKAFQIFNVCFLKPNFFAALSALLICNTGWAQNLPDKDCIATAYNLAFVQLNDDDIIEVVNFNSVVKYFSRKSGALLGRAERSPFLDSKQAKNAIDFDLSEDINKKNVVYTARAKEPREKDTITYEKILNVKGDKFDVHYWANGHTGMAFIKTKTSFYFLSPYRIDTLTNDRSATAAYFKNTFNGFHPAEIEYLSYPIYDKGLGVTLTKTGTLITVKDGIVAQDLPKPIIHTTNRDYFLFWDDNPYLTYTATGGEMVTLNYETGEILRIVTIPIEVKTLFSKYQKSGPMFKPLSDNEFLIHAKLHDPITYIWYFNKGEIIPLCDPASKEEYADAKKKSDAFYAWQAKDRRQQQELKQQADEKWAREHTVTRSQCGACGGKGGTSVENVTSASGVGYRTVYKTDGFGNKTYVTSNYGKTYYPCKQCNGTGMVYSKGK